MPFNSASDAFELHPDIASFRTERPSDDDVHVRVPPLIRFLETHRERDAAYFGCMKSGQVVHDPKYKWYEKEWKRFGNRGNQYFRHATGQAYGLSRAAARFVRDNRAALHKYANEDVSVATWMLALDVDFVDDRALCCQSCVGRDECIVTHQWNCTGMCDAANSIPAAHAACPQDGVAVEATKNAIDASVGENQSGVANSNEGR